MAWAPLPVDLASAVARREVSNRIECFRQYGTLFVSANSLGKFARCETQAVVAAMGYRGGDDSIKMELGSRAHETIASVRKGGSVDAALGDFAARWAPWVRPILDDMVDGEKAAAIERVYGVDNASRVLRVYLEQWHPQYPYRFVPEWVECAFAVPFDADCAQCRCPEADHFPGSEMTMRQTPRGLQHLGCAEYRPRILLCGKVDALVYDELAVEWLVDDLKTTGRLDDDFARGFTIDSQFSTYLWAVPRAFGVAPAGSVVTALEWSRMPIVRLTKAGRPEKCRTHTGVTVDECHDLHCKTKQVGPFNRTEGQLAAWHANATRIANRMHDVYSAIRDAQDVAEHANMYGTFTHECGYCPARGWCEGERVGEYLESAMRFEPWEGESCETK